MKDACCVMLHVARVFFLLSLFKALVHLVCGSCRYIVNTTCHCSFDDILLMEGGKGLFSRWLNGGWSIYSP